MKPLVGLLQHKLSIGPCKQLMQLVFPAVILHHGPGRFHTILSHKFATSTPSIKVHPPALAPVFSLSDYRIAVQTQIVAAKSKGQSLRQSVRKIKKYQCAGRLRVYPHSVVDQLLYTELQLPCHIQSIEQSSFNTNLPSQF